MILQIAERLKKHFLLETASADITIFLCGGAGKKELAFRRLVGTSICKIRSKYRYSVYYPEDMFVELVLGHQKQDLLTLENLLASSVSAVAILLQSAGTFTELGAFSNHELLKNKLVVIVDPKYRKAQSFINTGPLRHLKNETSSHVLFVKMTEDNLDEVARVLVEAARAIGATHPPRRNLTNPILCYEFYLSLLYVLDPIPRCALSLIAQSLELSDPRSAETAVETVINGLINNGDALLISRNLTISKKGIEKLIVGAGSIRKLETLMEMFSSLRIIALNGMLRRRYKHFWGEAALT